MPQHRSDLATDRPDPEALTGTRRAWHGIAELILAGPQYRRSGTIRLRVAPGGFASVAEPDLRVEGHELVASGRRIPLNAVTCAELAAAVGVDVGAPAGLYDEGSGATPDDPVAVDAVAARYLGRCLALGDAALRRFAPEASPVLWPEHFDLGITIDAVNYGISLGDGYLAEPYAYVGPWTPREGDFWNAPFGAARPLPALSDVDGVVTFFAAGADEERRATGGAP